VSVGWRAIAYASPWVEPSAQKLPAAQDRSDGRRVPLGTAVGRWDGLSVEAVCDGLQGLSLGALAFDSFDYVGTQDPWPPAMHALLPSNSHCGDRPLTDQTPFKLCKSYRHVGHRFTHRCRQVQVQVEHADVELLRLSPLEQRSELQNAAADPV
jgi:hypothetical protein